MGRQIGSGSADHRRWVAEKYPGPRAAAPGTDDFTLNVTVPPIDPRDVTCPLASVKENRMAPQKAPSNPVPCRSTLIPDGPDFGRTRMTAGRRRLVPVCLTGARD